MPHVGYWARPGDALALRAPVVVASLEHAAALEPALGDRYVSAFYGLRPDVLLALYVERSLWERFLARAAASGSTPGCVGTVRVVALRTGICHGTVGAGERVVTPPELVLVVPCYNEAARLDAAAFLHFASAHPSIGFVFVDDGSTDATAETLSGCGRLRPRR